MYIITLITKVIFGYYNFLELFYVIFCYYKLFQFMLLVIIISYFWLF
jgi:hypothetical protein